MLSFTTNPLISRTLAVTGEAGGLTAREGPGEDYTVSMEYGFPLYTFYIPFKGTQ